MIDYKKLLKKVLIGCLNEEGYGFTTSLLHYAECEVTVDEIKEFIALIDEVCE